MELEKHDEGLDLTIEIGREHAKGFTARQVARRLDLSVKDVNEHLSKYKELVKWAAKSNVNLAEKLQLVIEEVDEHYRMIINEAWKNKESAEVNDKFGTVNQALTLIANVEKQRAQMHRENMDGTDAELMEQLEETEQRQEKLIGILKSLKEKFPDAARFVQSELTDVTDEPVELEVLDN